MVCSAPPSMRRLEMEYTEEELKKLKAVDDAFRDLEGMKIPFNLICQHFAPLQKWLNKILRGDEKNYGVRGK